MTIWRGEGGGGDATTDSEINFITSLTNSIAGDTIIASNAATSATASASSAATSASNANVSAIAASSSASAASGSASVAFGFANDAASSYDSFDDRYLGSKTVAPTLDNDGNTLLVGALYWNSVTTKLFVWSGTAWRDGFFTGLSSSLVTATAGQAVVATPTYTVGTNTIQVYVNGLKVILGTDFTETSTTSITFASGLTLGDEVELVVVQSLTIGTAVASNVSYTPTGTIAATNVQNALSEIISDSAASSGSSLVGYLPSGTGAVATTVQTKLREAVSVKDFGAVGDGVTNDSAAVQAAIDTVETLGGNLIFPPGKYLFGSQVTINRTYAAAGGGNFVGERNLIISGYGAEIRTTGGISAFDVRGGWIPNHNCLIEGFTIYHRNNTQAVGGIRIIGASLVTCKEVSVVVSSSLPVGYAAFSLENSTPSDNNTGCFWCLIDQCSIRPWAGAEGYVTYGVKAMGAANALTLRNNNFSGSNTHVILMPHLGLTYTSNSVNIDGNFFEGPSSSIGIELNSSAVIYHISGTRITNNRFEVLNTAVALTGTGTNVQLPTYMSGNYADTSLPNYVVNTLNIPLIMLDFVIVGAPMGPAKLVNNEGVLIESKATTIYNPLTVIPGNLNLGLALQTRTGVALGKLQYSNVAGGNGMQLAGTWSPFNPLTIKGCQGIAVRDISANNLANESAFSAATTKTVTFPVAETDANYLIFLEARADQKLWVTGKTTTQFVVNSDVSSSNGFGWLLIRHR